MEKGALLPIRFYPALSWTDYERFTEKMGGDFVIPKTHSLFLPPFQMTVPDAGQHWGEGDFDTMELIDYNDGTTIDLLVAPTTYFSKAPDVYSKAGDFRALVNYYFPLDYSVESRIPDGRYYFHIADFEDTHWYSEIFELCDLELDALTAEFDNETNFDIFASTYDATDEIITTTFCNTTLAAGEASAYTEIEVFLGEELDLFVDTGTYGVGCAGPSDWDYPVFFELRDSAGLLVSNTVEANTTATQYTFRLISEVGGTVRLYMYIDDATANKGGFELWLQRCYTENHIQLRYSNDKSFCKIFYENDYENIFFIDAKQVIDQQNLEENVVEDDQANKYRLIGTNQKLNSLQFSAGESMLNAMSLLRLHGNIQFVRETGEPVDIVEILLEQSVVDYEAATIKLVYREESCSVESCGFESCCPTLGSPIMQEVYAVLPAAAAGNNGWYALDETAGDQYRMYLSNGAAWNLVTTWDVADNCIEARQNSYSGNRFFWYDTGVSRWRLFIDLAAVNDNADGTADLVTDTEYRDGLTIVGQYQDADGLWHECTEHTDLTAGGGAETLVTFSSVPGVGTWTFRLHAYTTDCDYGYSNEVSQTIT